MKFYNREREIKNLERVQTLSLSEGQMTVLVGRRRIGKTQLLLKSTEQHPTLYFFVTRKAENMLCRDFIEEIQSKLNVPIGDYSSFGKLFEHLLILAKERPFCLIIDEFQDFMRVNTSVFSEMQKYWDLHKKTSKMNLLISGSIYSLMHKIFEDNKEPLFSRAGQIINLKT
jgi:AAA+ ATPase superfamily predicted ATPase